jgi:hypothetical protein
MIYTGMILIIIYNKQGEVIRMEEIVRMNKKIVEIIIPNENLKIKRHGSKYYTARIVNMKKREMDRVFVGGWFNIKQIKQWKQVIIAFERDIKELK